MALIVAAGRNQAIGYRNQLPWRLSGDLQYFKSVTLGKPIIMGRKTWDSIGRPLPGRRNIVVSRQRDWPAPEGVLLAHSLDQALALAEQEPGDEIMVMGGAELYQQALPLAQRVYLTRVDLAPEADTFFPVLPAAEWQCVSRREGDPESPVAYRFEVLERVKAQV
ncbi:dihydrofolate reductase [Marinimicrobium alkaliphilum]|uniref:dihydrofolate reductase n=1 Tax=Marinimicrobium alkaliphilum TaxID=2202654 RepID=UPI001E5193F2|nr:dihydrofolate reductase [Marinimicrobium alkaliphilum]